MKIKNISNQELSIPMKRSNGHKLIVKLSPGQIVYSEAEKKHENKQLVIWERKQAIEITDELLPSGGEYCHPYSTIKRTAPVPVQTPILEVVSDEEAEEDEDIPTEMTELPEISEDDEEEPTITTEGEVVVKKRGGGRPKGAKNKPKKRKRNKKAPSVNIVTTDLK